MHDFSWMCAVLLALGVLVGGCRPTDSTEEAAGPTPPDSVRQVVEEEIEALNEMRESLAASIDSAAVTQETFNRVCKPVGRRAKEISAEHGWIVQQLADRYRNPANKLDEEARRLYDHFEADPEKTATWIETVRENTDGWRYARRIPVRPSCLACHGAKAERPDFVKKGYPDDRAYGFEAGDLRGLYTVFVPRAKQDQRTQSSTANDAP